MEILTEIRQCLRRRRRKFCVGSPWVIEGVRALSHTCFQKVCIFYGALGLGVYGCICARSAPQGHGRALMSVRRTQGKWHGPSATSVPRRIPISFQFIYDPVTYGQRVVADNRIEAKSADGSVRVLSAQYLGLSWGVKALAVSPALLVTLWLLFLIYYHRRYDEPRLQRRKRWKKAVWTVVADVRRRKTLLQVKGPGPHCSEGENPLSGRPAPAPEAPNDAVVARPADKGSVTAWGHAAEAPEGEGVGAGSQVKDTLQVVSVSSVNTSPGDGPCAAGRSGPAPRSEEVVQCPPGTMDVPSSMSPCSRTEEACGAPGL